ncbi:MAG: extracellular solute-binding protein [Lachnospiraceae bacterium]|nr:extracellular solute-binding protein [Lachnospiraceae bacterium]
MKMKNVLGVLLSVVMITGLLTGCGDSQTVESTSQEQKSSSQVETQSSASSEEVQDEVKEPAHIVVAMYNPAVLPLNDQMEEYINNLDCMKEANLTVDIISFTYNDYYQKIELGLAAGDQYDLVYAPQTYYTLYSSNGVLADISELLTTKYTTLYDMIPDVFWNGLTIDGKIYGVPTLKEYAAQWGIIVSNKLLEDTGIKAEDITDWKSAYDLLVAAGANGRNGLHLNSTSDYSQLFMYDKYVSISGAAAVEIGNESAGVVNKFESDYYKEMVYYQRELYEAGAIHPEVMENVTFDQETEKLYGARPISYTPFAEAGILNGEATYIPMTSIRTDTSVTRGSIWGVTNRCENKDAAVAFLELWNTVPEIKNTFAYGLEGISYNLVDGKVKRTDDYRNWWRAQNWQTGNMFISYLETSEPDGKYEAYEEWCAQTTASAILGFSFDATNVSAQVAACNAVIKEYSPALFIGVIEKDQIESYLATFNEQLYASGLQDIIDEMNAQLDVWFANQK